MLESRSSAISRTSAMCCSCAAAGAGKWGADPIALFTHPAGLFQSLGVAIAVHLMVDLPYTLHGIGSVGDQREDFVRFGDILLEVFPDIITDIQADYHTDVTGLLNGFCFGAWVDGVTSEGTMTAFIYQGVRLKAWRDGQNLRHFPRWMVATDIRTAWGMAEVALATLDAQGAL